MPVNKYANPYAQLRVLDGPASAKSGSNVVIEFPAMPEVIELAREAEYNVQSYLNLPDGLHIYQKTAPLTIPISFKLHAFSDYTTRGAIDLIQMGRRLHALTLPIRSGAGGASSGSTSGVPALTPPTLLDQGYAGGHANQTALGAGTGGSTNAFGPALDKAVPSLAPTSAANQANYTSPTYQGAGATGDLPAFPAVCLLRVMVTGGTPDAPGINCVGYVQRANVAIRGPYLQTDDGGYNLPSSIEVSFTFVHAPTYRNKLSSGTALAAIGNVNGQAYAVDVLERFYSQESLALAGASAADFQGLPDAPATK